MANQEHLRILQQGREQWNTWREKHPEIQPDLSNAILSEDNLSGINLSSIDLSLATLVRTNLSGANLIRTFLKDADLSNANLSAADLRFTDLSGARLNNTNFTQALILQTIFGYLDLRPAKGLETIQHDGPSYITTSTLERSQGQIPEIFLRGAGLSNTFIEYIRSLVQSPIQYYTCFISYSSKNQDFAERLYTDLQSKGVRCWFAPEDMKTGDKIRHRIDTSIRLYDKLLLILSEASVESQWVEHEVETAIGKEIEGRANVLFPVRLDDTVMQSKVGWASHIKLTRHITDFSQWKHHDAYQKSLDRLLRDLKADTVR